MFTTAVSKKDKDWAIAIVNFCLEECIEDILLHNQYFSCKASEWWDKHINNFYEQGLTLVHGATKICVIDDNNPDWVVKLGFEPQEPGAYRTEVVNFCEKEKNFYEQACRLGLGKYFAPTYQVGEVEGIKVFVQEREEVDEMVIEDSFREWCSESDQYSYSCSYDCYYDMSDEEIVWSIYGESEETHRLNDFLEINDIGDLHSQNWGINSHSGVVLIDYSGYC